MEKSRKFEKSDMTREEFEQFERDVQVKLSVEETQKVLQRIFDRCAEGSYTKAVTRLLMENRCKDRIVFTFDGSYLDSRINLGLADGIISIDDNFGWGVLKENHVVYRELAGKDAAETLLPAILNRYKEVMVLLPIHTNSGIYDICSEVYNKLQGNGVMIPIE